MHHGDDSLHQDGTPMDDVLIGGPDADILHSLAGDDILWGGAGDDDIGGGAGNDRLIGGPGADALNGGPGTDIASYTGSTRGVRVDLGTSFSSGGDDAPVRGGEAEGDSLTGIEIIWGSEFADLLIGSHAPNELFGRGGNDHVHGGGGNDLLRGGDGDDVLGADEHSDEGGDDILYGDDGFDFLHGGAGNDILRGGAGDDELNGGMGNDVLEGGTGGDSLTGGGGSDTASYTMSGEAVTVNLGVAADAATADNPRAAGGDAAGDMIGTDIANVRGSMYADMLTGADAHDDYAAEDDPATDVDESKLDDGKNTLYGNQGDDTLKGMGGEDTLRGGKGMDTLDGGVGNDKLMGEMGDDDLMGGAGDDTLIGGSGADNLYGGTVDGDAGTADTADYSGSDAGVRIDLAATHRGQSMPTAEGGDAEGDSLMGIENLTGSPHTDWLQGNDPAADGTGGANLLKGGDGDDWDDQETTDKTEGGLFGRGGDDTLDGGAGMDWLSGGAGRDVLRGDAGDDMLIGGPGDDMPEPDDNDDATVEAEGGLYGGKGNDTLNGGAGDDLLNGGDGDDTLIYDAGDTMRDGGDGADTLDASAQTDDVTVNLSVLDDDSKDSANLTSIENVIGGDGDDTVTGSKVANLLKGGKGNDTLDGGAGNDTLDGGAGNDTLKGGVGADTFVFGKGHETDVIGDKGAGFSKVQGDKIDLSGLNLTEDDLATLLGGAHVTESAGKATIVLALGADDSNATGLNVDGGGTITVYMDTPFATLDADDFII